MNYGSGRAFDGALRANNAPDPQLRGDFVPKLALRAINAHRWRASGAFVALFAGPPPSLLGRRLRELSPASS